MRSISGSFAMLALLALLAASAGPAGAQQQPAPPSGGAAEISVNLVELPVEVTRGGEPVQGLTAADFEVREKGGRALPVVAFETVDLGGTGRPAAAAGAPVPSLSMAARRHVFLLFDFASSRPERLRTGVAGARELVAQHLDPRDLVAVGAYMPTGEVPILLNFTADRAAADRTLATIDAALSGKAPAAAPDARKGKDGDPLQLAGIDPKTLLFQSERNEVRNTAGEALYSLGRADGTWGSFLQHNVLNHSRILHRPNVEAAQTDHVMAMAEAMAGLGDALRPVTGRKYLALFSEGWPMSLADGMPATAHDPTYGGSELLGKLRETLGDLVRSGWVLHAVDLAGTRADQLSDTTSGLFYLANETGGALVSGTNRLAEGLGGAMEKSAHGYVLTVQVDDGLDGAFHPLDVRLRDAGSRARVRSSGGYFAALPYRQQKGVQRLADAARLVAGEAERDELGVQVAAVPLASGDQGTTVAVLVEIPGRSLLASPGPQLGLEVFGYALDAAGSTSDFFAQAVALDRGKLGDRLAQGGVRVLGRLALAPGPHRLRLLVRDRADGRVSLLTVPLSQPAATGGAAQLDAFFLPPSQDSWVLVHPSGPVFAVQGREVLPAAHASLAPSGEAQLLLLGRGLTGPGMWIRGRVLDAQGKPARGGEVELLSVTPGEAGEPDLMVGRLRAGTLPTGPYLLELRLGGAKGAPQAVSVRPFAVAQR